MNKKILNQIKRLCEKQYRKGFQQGYYASINKEMTKEQVDKFRGEGSAENYSKVIHPHNGRKENPCVRLAGELTMPNAKELHDIFYRECIKKGAI